MTTPIATTEAEPKEKPIIGRMETDVFCVHCHYNLHGQTVWRDERLEIPVCRCPECGRHHPAGAFVTAATQWMLRLSSVVLLIWIVFLLLLLVAAGTMMFAMSIVHIETYTTSAQLTASQLRQLPGIDVDDLISNRSGRNYAVINGNAMTGNGAAMPETTYYFRVPRADLQKVAPGTNDYDPGYAPALVLGLVSTLCAVIVGLIGAVAMHHLPPARCAWLLIVPIIAAIFVRATMLDESYYALCKNWGMQRIGLYTAIDIAAILITLVVGRKLMRGIVRTFIPQRLRGPLGFLWLADGLTPPTPKLAPGI